MSKLLKSAPDSIYLVVCDDEGCESSFNEHHEVTWCEDKQNESDILYIRAGLIKPTSKKAGCKRCGMLGRDNSGDVPSCSYCGIRYPDYDAYASDKEQEQTKDETEPDIWGDLRFIQRVLESDAPSSDRETAASMVRAIRMYYQNQATMEAKAFPKLVNVITPKENAVNCNPHPKAPHGFNRNGSHNADRYVCECENWDAYEAGYQKGLEDGLSERLG